MKPPIYQTPNFVLKPYTKEDQDVFIEMGTDPEVLKFMGNASGNREEERALFQRVLKLYENTNTDRWFWVWGIYKKGDLCGHIELKETENTTKEELEIVYMIHPNYRKQGVISEVLLYLKGKQKEWNRTIIATIDLDNELSIKSLEKWGIAKKEILTDDEGEYYKITLHP